MNRLLLLLPLLAFKQKQKSAFKIVMRMAGLYWYERIVDGTTPAAEYEFIFNYEINIMKYFKTQFIAETQAIGILGNYGLLEIFKNILKFLLKNHFLI